MFDLPENQDRQSIFPGDPHFFVAEKEQQMQQMQQMQVKCIMIDDENAIISAAQYDWLCAQAEKVKNLEKHCQKISGDGCGKA